jgi:glycerophosphodiester phosphodiesterase
MYISKAQSQSPRGDLPSMAETRHLERSEVRRTRSLSLNAYEDSRTTDFNERMKHTFEFKLKGFKGNTTGDYIHESFITLKELLEKLPEPIAFNIEISKSLPPFIS